jgi:hypothetical protein
MAYELWFQYDSSDGKKYREGNKSLVDFLNQHISRLVPVIKSKIQFKIVDVSNPKDVSQAKARRIKELPCFIVNGTPITKLSDIKRAIEEMIETKSGGRRKNRIPEEEVHIDRNGGYDKDFTHHYTEDDAEIEDMWRDEMEASDQEDDEKDDVEARKERAAELADRRKAQRDKTAGRGGRRVNVQRRSAAGRDRTPRKKSNSRPRTRSQSPPQSPEQSQSPPPERRKTAKKRTSKSIDNPAELSKNLEGNALQQEDDALMSQFWENTLPSS